jgi:hypothetical protein
MLSDSDSAYLDLERKAHVRAAHVRAAHVRRRAADVEMMICVYDLSTI